jgi:Concanavalin A-like lectin/glucanases superfamily
MALLDKCPVKGALAASRYPVMKRSRRAASLAIGGAILAFTLAAPAASSASGPLAGWWPMNEGQGQTVYDWSGNRNHGTLGSTSAVEDNDPTWTQGMFGSGRALAFNNNDIVTVPRDRSLEPRRLTVSTWIRGDGSPGAWRYIVSKGSDACEAASYGLYTGRDGGLAFYIYDGAEFHVSAEAPATVWDGRWHNAAGTFDGSKVRLFVDGRQVGPATAVPAGTAIEYPLANGSGGIGGYTDASCGLTLNGDIDTVRIWNQALPIEFYWAIARSLFQR